MKQLTDYIKIYEDGIDKELCEDLVDFYENHESLTERFDNNGYPSFTRLNLTHIAGSGELHERVLKTLLKANDRYIEDLNIVEFPHKYAFEEMIIKKYNNDGIDHFGTHVDVTSHASAKRFLVFLFYLNDVEEGGETGFPHLDIELKPKQGTVLIFPPLWLYKHYGKIPVSNTKYILTSYLHYIDYEFQMGEEDSNESDIQS